MLNKMGNQIFDYSLHRSLFTLTRFIYRLTVLNFPRNLTRYFKCKRISFRPYVSKIVFYLFISELI